PVPARSAMSTGFADGSGPSRTSSVSLKGLKRPCTSRQDVNHERAATDGHDAAGRVRSGPGAHLRGRSENDLAVDQSRPGAAPRAPMEDREAARRRRDLPVAGTARPRPPAVAPDRPGGTDPALPQPGSRPPRPVDAPAR